MLYGFYQKVNNVCMWTIQVSEGFVDCARVLFVTRGREIVAESEDSTTTNQSVAKPLEHGLTVLFPLDYLPLMRHNRIDRRSHRGFGR